MCLCILWKCYSRSRELSSFSLPPNLCYPIGLCLDTREALMLPRINCSLVPSQDSTCQWSSNTKFQHSGTQAIFASTVHCAPSWGATFSLGTLASGKHLLIIALEFLDRCLLLGAEGYFSSVMALNLLRNPPPPFLISCHKINSLNVMPHANTLIRSYLMKSKQNLSFENIGLLRNSKQIGDSM